ncbi:MAG: NrtA/SsuA/CpmA family ABC transporter substrate-binding protein [Gammaproteobacteria bacterium]|nr:NrtA/SsuA/CpmA family ABC transporter substrate-binding protein [Gammaproteobacteria bacterium]MBU1416417.1 NrtA/SsuA/CpmA family ABC transporter substrate-binding protein [Gammaproteobacteria bacterium]
MKRVFKIAIGLAAIVSVGAFALQPTALMDWLGWHTSDTLRLGAYEGDVGALPWIAQDQGFFRKVGLDVQLQGNASGKDATDALRAGQTDVAMASEFVVASRSFSEPDLRVLGSASFYRNKGVVGRRDRGISVPTDLKGKRIGVTSPSGAEYSLTVFLAMYGLTVQDVDIVKLPPQGLVEAIGTGDIDAAITWEPHVGAIEAALGPNGISFQGDGLDVYLLLVTRQQVADANSKAIAKLFRALVLAEEWARDHPEEAKGFIAARFKLDPAYVNSMWWRTQLSITLPQELLTAMDSEARWLAGNGDAPATIPDYSRFLRADELLSVKPSAVTLVLAPPR